MRKIIYTRSDGGVSVVNLPSEATDEDFAKELEMVKAERQPADTPVIVEDPRPASRYFRNAWGRNGNRIAVDMSRARAIKTDHIRVERAKVLPPNGMGALDVELRDAMLDGNAFEIARLRTVIQQWRDLPATIQPDLEAISTPEALETYEPRWPI